MVERLEKMAEDSKSVSEMDPVELAELKDASYKPGEPGYKGRATEYDCEACVSNDCACNICDY